MATLRASFTNQRIPDLAAAGHLDSLLAFEETAAALDLESWIVDRFRHPEQESTAYLQLIHDDGDAFCIPLIQIQHSSVCGPMIGSLSIAPDLQMRYCAGIAMERSWQAALLGLPFGGASYGLVCDPNELSERELVRLLGLAGRQLDKFLTPDSLLFPGRGCQRELIAKLFAGMRSSRDVNVTGKPGCLGGLNHDQFAAEGIAAMISAALRHAGKSPEGATVVIQGFGPTGQAVSRRLADEGLTIIGLSDSSGGLYRSDGFILDDILAQFEREPLLFSYAEAEHITRAELLHIGADVLVVSAGAHEIDDNSWNAVPAQLIVEADWNAVTSSAVRKMEAGGRLVIPWLLASAGSVLASCFEGRNLQILCSPKELLSRTHACFTETMANIFAYLAVNQCSFHEATLRIAIERAAERLRAAGSA